MIEATSLKANGETAASCLWSRFIAGGYSLNVSTAGPPARQLGIRLWTGFLMPLAYHEMPTLGANGFITDELVPTIGTRVWKIEDLTIVHYKRSPVIENPETKG